MSARQSPRSVVVTGVGLVSPLGTDPGLFHDALCEGRSGWREIGLFETDGLPDRLAGEIDFNPKDYLPPDAKLRPLDRTGRLVAVAAELALDDSGWTSERREEEAVGLVLGTMFCSVHTIAGFDRRAVEAGPKYAKPFDFANSVINAAAGQAAIWHQLRGLNSTVAGGPAAGVLALGYAAEMIRLGRARVLLAGGAEELSWESFLGFSRTGLLCPGPAGGEPRAVPLDARRNGFRLGEGAAFLVLEDAELARERGARVLAEITGHANAYDSSRGRDAERAARTVDRSLRLALEDAGLEPDAVDAVSLAANGSVDGDRHEARGLGSCFGERTNRLPVTAVKSMLGEALGASGAFQAVALLESMRRGRWPGIPGLGEVEKGLPLGGAASSSREIDVSRGLVHGLGFDGNSGAVVFERREAA